MSGSDKLPSRKPRGVDHLVLPGGLSEQDHDRIHELAEKRWAASRIARAISKHRSTVYWYMVREGLIVAKQTDTPLVVMRGGRVIRQFSRDEDAFILACRLEGHRPRRIAELASERFGFERRPHSVACRLAMLATLEGDDQQEAA